ncbi:MAG TPA: hypothetical protein VGR43_07290, partial [Dehalococcoidia bacterium]|nr:hypothetical protein [Dehalococcoidia bacterium]
MSIAEPVKSERPSSGHDAIIAPSGVHTRSLYLAFFALFVVAFTLSASLGAVAVPPLDVLRVLGSHLLPVDLPVSPIDDTIVWDI